MKNLTLLSILIFFCQPCFAQQDEQIYEVVEDKPRFLSELCEMKGKPACYSCCDTLLFDYITKNVKYPKDAYDAGIEGKVYVKFIIRKDGYISDITLARGKHNSLDKEALRVVNKMAEEIKWMPGHQNGVPVHTYMVLPIAFKI